MCTWERVPACWSWAGRRPQGRLLGPWSSRICLDITNSFAMAARWFNSLQGPAGFKPLSSAERSESRGYHSPPGSALFPKVPWQMFPAIPELQSALAVLPWHGIPPCPTNQSETTFLKQAAFEANWWGWHASRCCVGKALTSCVVSLPKEKSQPLYYSSIAAEGADRGSNFAILMYCFYCYVDYSTETLGWTVPLPPNLL